MSYLLRRRMAMLFMAVLAGSGVGAATISSAAAEGGPTTPPTPTENGTTDSADPETTPTEVGTTDSSDAATTETTPTTPGMPPFVPPVLPGGFAQAVTTLTTVVVGAPITVAGTINNTTINLPAVTPDICGNLPGSQPSVPVGHVLTLSTNGALVCVTPTIARTLHPAAVAYQVPAGSRIIFPKRGGGLCIGPSSAKPVIVPANTSAKKVIALAKTGKLVCLGP